MTFVTPTLALHRAQLDAIAAALVAQERLTQEDLMKILGDASAST